MCLKRILPFLLLSLLLSSSLYSQNLKIRNEVQFTEIKRPYKTISPYISSLLKRHVLSFYRLTLSLKMNLSMSLYH